MNLINKESGYLIIEVLLAITILASLVCYFNEIMGTIFTEWEEKTKFISLQERGELSLNFLADYIRNSCEIHIDNADEIEIKAEYLDQGIKWIKFNIYTSKGSPTLGMKVGEEINDIIEYSRNSPLINNIKEIKFEDLKGDLSLIKVFLEITNHEGQIRHFTTYVSPRYRRCD